MTVEYNPFTDGHTEPVTINVQFRQHCQQFAMGNNACPTSGKLGSGTLADVNLPTNLFQIGSNKQSADGSSTYDGTCDGSCSFMTTAGTDLCSG